MPEEETTAMSYAPAFCPSDTMNTFNEKNVLNNIPFADMLNILHMKVLKEQSHFHQVSPDGSLSVITHLQSMMQLIEPEELVFA